MKKNKDRADEVERGIIETLDNAELKDDSDSHQIDNIEMTFQMKFLMNL